MAARASWLPQRTMQPSITNQLARIAELEALILSQAERISAQAELLSKRADKPRAWALVAEWRRLADSWGDAAAGNKLAHKFKPRADAYRECAAQLEAALAEFANRRNHLT